jgi:hypothetical protein
MVVRRNSMFQTLTVWGRLLGMDVLDDLLAGTRARGGVFNLTIMDPPWALQICDEAALSLATMVRGSAWVRRDGVEPALMSPGDIAVFTGPSPYVVGDALDTAPSCGSIRVDCANRCLGPLSTTAPGSESARTAVAPKGRQWLPAAPISWRATSAGDYSLRCRRCSSYRRLMWPDR